ncbi:MAG: hypothetical protein GWN48_17180, partial [Actinobacteria bacterium]|nr:hypothetical protein [Actinomycetota bacterium]
MTSYRIYRNNTAVADTNDTSYSDLGLSPLTTYDYRVTALDDSDNESVSTPTVQATTGDPPPVSDDLVAFYRMETGFGTLVEDSTANANHGTLVGGTWAPSAQFGGGIEFDGVDDHVDLGGLDVVGTGLTVMAW